MFFKSKQNFLLPKLKINGYLNEFLVKLIIKTPTIIPLKREYEILEFCFSRSNVCHTCYVLSKAEKEVGHVCNEHCVPDLTKIKPTLIHFIDAKENVMKTITINNCTTVDVVTGAKKIKISN